MESLGQSIRRLRKARGLTLAQVAAHVGTDTGNLSRIERDKQGVSPELLALIAEVFGVPLKGPFAEENTTPGPDIRGLVPLISSVQAGEWTEISDHFHPGDAANWLPCPVKHGPHTFCLVVEGESMRNPEAKPSYDPGDIIFVDPDIAPSQGDRVVARLEGRKEATFKQYIEEDGRKLLKALNPDWKPRYLEIDEDATLCGVVIGKWVPE